MVTDQTTTGGSTSQSQPFIDKNVNAQLLVDLDPELENLKLEEKQFVSDLGIAVFIQFLTLIVGK